jgi:outer membrane receptor protein involved in Fe transport
MVQILSTLLVFAAFQSNGTITGTIKVPAGMSRVGITIELAGGNTTVISNAEGNYTFTNVPPGENIIVVSGGGLVPQVRTLDVAPAANAIVDFDLETVRSSIRVVESLAEYVVPEVSSATKSPTRILDAPQSIQVFPNQVIEDRSIVEGNELFRNISGINQSPYSSMVFRGFTQREILYNGARGNPFGSLDGDVAISGFSTSQIRLTNIQRVEVLKGPVSALYGSSEPGGLINYVTKKPTETRTSEFQARFGNFDQKMFSGDFSGPVSENLFYRAALYLEDRDSFRNNAGTRNYHVPGNLLWRPNSRSQLTGEYEFIKQELPGQRLRGVPVNSAGAFLTDIRWTATEPSDFIHMDGHVFQLRGDHALGRNWTIDHTFPISHLRSSRELSRAARTESAHSLGTKPCSVNSAINSAPITTGVSWRISMHPSRRAALGFTGC